MHAFVHEVFSRHESTTWKKHFKQHFDSLESGFVVALLRLLPTPASQFQYRIWKDFFCFLSVCFYTSWQQAYPNLNQNFITCLNLKVEQVEFS